MQISFRINIAVALAIVLAFCACSAAAQASPQRIVSLSPGATEILFALGLGRKVVGDTTYCDYPPAAKLKPHIGDSTTNFEAVLALRPDLVIADAIANGGAIGKLKALHLPLLIISAYSLSDVEANIVKVGAATGSKKKAAEVVAQMHLKELMAQEIVARRHGTLRALLIVGIDPLYVAGNKSFMGEMVRRAGAGNVAGDVGYSSWSKETALASRPQVIFYSVSTRDLLARDPVWRVTPAVRLGNVFDIDQDSTSRPGPRLADALLTMANDLARARR